MREELPPPGHDVRHLLLVPSFWGAITWIAWLVLYAARLVPLDQLSLGAAALFIVLAVAFVASFTVLSPRYREVLAAPGGAEEGPARWVLVLLHAIGFVGIGKYVLDLSGALGGLGAFGVLLMGAPSVIRQEMQNTVSAGLQISYAGWLAVALTVLGVRTGRLPRRWLGLAAAQFVANLVTTDRVRPLWILFCAGVMLVPTARQLTWRRVVVVLGGGVAVLASIFIGLGLWTGKVSSDSETQLPAGTEEVYRYGVGGFAYFNYIFEHEHRFEYLPARIAYTPLKVLNAAGLAPEPPNPILDFYPVPFETNVGTALEPFYRDGGVPFVLFGVLAISFGADLLALYLWRRGPYARFAAANVCFASSQTFFAWHLVSPPIWLFVGIGLAPAAWIAVRRVASASA